MTLVRPNRVRRRRRSASVLRNTGADRGSASLLVLWVACLVWWLGVGSAYVASAMTARHRAAATADLAALAAADRAFYGPVAACRSAREVALAMAGRVERCSVNGLVADVTVLVQPVLRVPGESAVTVRARAGPSSLASAGPGGATDAG